MEGLRSFDYDHDGFTLKGEIALPEGPGPHPAVLVMHDALGLGNLMRHKALALAKAGYVALASDMYGRGRFATPAEGMDTYRGVSGDPALLRGRVLAAYDALRGAPGVDASRIGAIGYCFGGQCVLELARSGADARGVVSFHGLLTTAQPARAGEVKAKVLAITGALDPYAPAEHRAGFQAEMAAAEADWQMTVYGKGWHAFTEEDAPEIADIPGVRYDPLLDRLSWAEATAFLEAVVRG